MARPLYATIYLCYPPYHGIKTNMDKAVGMFMKNKEGNIYLKERGGKREFQYSGKYAYKVYGKGAVELLCFYDKDSLLQINPKEIMSGEEFSRTDIRNLITGQINAERRLRTRIGLEPSNKTNLILGMMFVIAALLMLISSAMYSNSMSNPHITVQVTDKNYTPTGASIGKLITGAANALGAAGTIP